MACDILSSLTDRQKEAVCHTEGPLLVIAGPGSGKTRVITSRVAFLASRGVPPWNILCLTFTNKAAEEMRERVAAASGTDGAWLSTFHSLCARLLRRDLSLEGYSRDFTIYDRSDQTACLKALLKELNLDPVEAGLSRLPGRISAVKNRSPGAAPSRTDPVLARILEGYENRLRANNALDFDDLLLVFLKMIRTDGRILEDYRRRFRYILIDEYQDTNRLQYEIVKLLAQEHRNICVTGDPDQSIYGWRGADIRNILDFRKEYPDAATVFLEQNFRSVGLILKAAESLISRNVEREDKKLIPVLPQGDPPKILSAFDPEDEALMIAGEISALAGEGIEFGETAVLYRTNAQSRAIEAALRDDGIPYVIVGSVEFYQRREIKDFLAYMRLSANPKDDVAFLRVCNVPARGIGVKALEAIRSCSQSAGVPLLDAAGRAAEAPETPRKLRNGLRELLGVVDAVSHYSGGGMGGLVAHVANLTKYADHLRRTAGENAEEKVENVMELERACREWDDKHPEGTLQQFLEEISLLSDVDKWDRKEAVSLMTMHSSKGLEFDAVIMAGLEEGLLPHFGPEAEGDEMRVEEERRLCFVGMTRAKRRLVLSWAKNRRTPRGETVFGEPSRFLRESGITAVPPESTASRIQAGIAAAQLASTVQTGDSAPFRTGDRVRHLKLGEGIVVAMKGMGDAARVVVSFPGSGLKTFAVNIAPIIRINPGGM